MNVVPETADAEQERISPLINSAVFRLSPETDSGGNSLELTVLVRSSMRYD